ncbi:hypothetical protein [Oceanirhabdus sp. W0125-5]|uniref:hypothetical protein n=1 Tax=Oceanirhabdus sp. W0125-5 TaxID=2999116 RepID=UPI0022F30C00|nr:hypothetical protein [Oceanirhabdus sp. W0125-5]WBW96499.1 hypothetical protein OW730_22805 [Oceanirhabdus sp. W0125-5]
MRVDGYRFILAFDKLVKPKGNIYFGRGIGDFKRILINSSKLNNDQFINEYFKRKIRNKICERFLINFIKLSKEQYTDIFREVFFNFDIPIDVEMLNKKKRMRVFAIELPYGIDKKNKRLIILKYYDKYKDIRNDNILVSLIDEFSVFNKEIKELEKVVFWDIYTGLCEEREINKGKLISRKRLINAANFCIKYY